MRKVSIIFIFIIASYVAYVQPPFWVKLAALSGDDQSKFYEFCLGRAYQNIKCEDSRYVKYLRDDNEILVRLAWIRILSATGNTYAYEYLHRKLIQAIKEDKKEFVFPLILVAIGYFGMPESSELILEALDDGKLNDFEKRIAIPTLYMIDGVNYGEKYEMRWVVSDEMESVREIVKNTRGACRTIDQIMAVDMLYRSYR